MTTYLFCVLKIVVKLNDILILFLTYFQYKTFTLTNSFHLCLLPLTAALVKRGLFVLVENSEPGVRMELAVRVSEQLEAGEVQDDSVRGFFGTLDEIWSLCLRLMIVGCFTCTWVLLFNVGTLFDLM